MRHEGKLSLGRVPMAQGSARGGSEEGVAEDASASASARAFGGHHVKDGAGAGASGRTGPGPGPGSCRGRRAGDLGWAGRRAAAAGCGGGSQSGGWRAGGRRVLSMRGLLARRRRPRRVLLRRVCVCRGRAPLPAGLLDGGRAGGPASSAAPEPARFLAGTRRVSAAGPGFHMTMGSAWPLEPGPLLAMPRGAARACWPRASRGGAGSLRANTSPPRVVWAGDAVRRACRRCERMLDASMRRVDAVDAVPDGCVPWGPGLGGQ